MINIHNTNDMIIIPIRHVHLKNNHIHNHIHINNHMDINNNIT